MSGDRASSSFKLRLTGLVGLALAFVFAPAGWAEAAETSQAAWTAPWISDPSASPTAPGVFHFRKVITLSGKPERFPIRISADNRYRLLVNGVEVASGPARGDLQHWRYETLDIAPQLRAGRNAIAVLVWNMGEFRPAAQVTLRTALVVQGDSPEAAVIDSNAGWKVKASDAYRFSRVEGDDSGGFYVAGPGEAVDAAQYPWGWESPDYDAGSWADARPIVQQFASPIALARGTQRNGSMAEWQLVPRTIPLPEVTPQRFAAVRRVAGFTVPPAFLAGQAPATVPPHTRATILLDQGALTIGHPVLATSGGRGARATLTYAESLFDARGDKGNRNVVEDKTIRGLRDTIEFDGGRDRQFRPLWLRAWRYIQLDITTADEALRLDDVRSLFTAYPFEQHASFASSAAWLAPIWAMNWRALRMSAYETFWDTPYYEQLQYVGDTRIEALMSVYQSGDARLMRSAIEHFDDSRSSEGLTASSYPSSLRQQIPPFSLWWIAMVHDYWMLRDDRPFVEGRMQGVRDVLNWFERHVDGSGLLGPMPWWNFLDWADGYPDGVPPGGKGGHSVALNLQFILALRQAAELEQAFGRPGDAERYRTLADQLTAVVRARAWDAPRGLFVDSPEQRSFSQQANALAVLAGVVPAEQERAVMERVLADPGLVQATFYFRFYVDEAMRRAGLADRYLDRLGPWREMVRNGLTTTAETPEPTRSDSHAWAAHPNYAMLATVLGIRPASPGFRTVSIAPALGALTHASGSMPHPQGQITVAFKRRGAGIEAALRLPAGLDGRFEWHGDTVPLHGGETRVICAPGCVVRPAPWPR